MTLLQQDAALTREAIAARRNRQDTGTASYVTFGVRALYGLSPESIQVPLSPTHSIESGQVCVTLDPEVGPSGNVGIVNFERNTLIVRYGVQAVFPGLYELVTSGRHDPSLLNPVRAVATDECVLTDDLTGWRALGCLEFLPGSIWAGAEGG